MAHDGHGAKAKDGHHYSLHLSHSRSKQAKRMLSFTEPVPALMKPLLTGYMFKQSHVLDVFNKRFFVLYPGYLVYYVKMHDWNSDVAKNTLQVSAVVVFDCSKGQAYFVKMGTRDSTTSLHTKHEAAWPGCSCCTLSTTRVRSWLL